MDLQNQLNQALNFFTRGKLKSSRVYVHSPDQSNLYRYCVVVCGEHDGKAFKGSSSGTSLYATFLKALSELGENIISDSLNLDSRSGIAGGLIRKNCIQRAKAELIERDAFLFHYRRLLPFKNHKSGENFISFTLNSIDPAYPVSFVMDPGYLNGSRECLVFGMGCDLTLDGCFQKAYGEYSAMYLNHVLFECRDQVQWTSKVDFHHAQSKSVENKLIFKDLCKGIGSDETRHYDPSLWTIEDLKSPLRFFRFVRVSHPQLELLKFGFPETSFQFTTPVYHPFW